MLQTVCIVLAVLVAVITVVVLARAVSRMVAVIRRSQPLSRTDHPARRWVTMLKETFLHTRMFQWRWVGVMHWFVYFGFLILSSAVATGFVQLFDPKWQIWWIGHWFVWEWINEGIGALSTVGIVFLIVYRQLHKPAQLGRKSRFFGSTFWQAYFVEFMALLEGVAILFIRGAEQKYARIVEPEKADKLTNFHFPISHLLGGLYGDSENALKSAILVIALIKVLSALVWLDVIALNVTMGIAWHRFTAWVNIWFKRESVGRSTDGATTALGAMKPLLVNGVPVTLDDIENERISEDAILGVGKIEDFAWKGILDFTTCTECGRCQSQCPAWNTDKPLSPKLLIMNLREQAYAGAGIGAGSHDNVDIFADLGVIDEKFDGLVDPDVLWSCTSCGACVQQCPVDIEHVDHIMDMRRYQVLVESNFPSELGGLFRGLESKGNPWNMSQTARLDWAKDLPFDVKVVGDDIESLESVDWLFWVGCAGAYEDRAKKTTRAVAELLDIAGITFGVLGNGETCTGDSARRAGNEFLYQSLATQNVETFKEYKVKQVVTTCAHCFNTLKNEYKDFGIELEVVHHTQLLNRLVRDGKLTPVTTGPSTAKRSITYHDPCYLGRHNGVYTPPRELLQVLPGADFVEPDRNSERSFCCGAGGARMWMEERLGERINRNRSDELAATGADQIAVGCPFCRVMISDGITAAQADGTAAEHVEVLDVAQLLLAAVKGDAPAAKTESAPVAKAAPVEEEPIVTATPVVEERAEDTPDLSTSETTGSPVAPEAPAPAGPRTGGPHTDVDIEALASLFDVEAPAAGVVGAVAAVAAAPAAPAAVAPAPVETPAAPTLVAAPAVTGPSIDDAVSLFDIQPDTTPAPAATPPVATAPAAVAPAPASAPVAAPVVGASSGTKSEPLTNVAIESLGSLFDIEAPAGAVTVEPGAAPAAVAVPVAAPAPTPVVAEAAPTPAPATTPVAAPAPIAVTAPVDATYSSATNEPKTDVDINALGSLFDA